MAPTKSFTLNNGLQFPAVGLGTFQGRHGAKDELAAITSIAFALNSGYRLIDTAQAYGVEGIVGKGIRASTVPRSEITLVTKMSLTTHDDPAASLEVSLRELGLDYVDVLLMHWPISLDRQGAPVLPGTSPTFVEVWKGMEKSVGEKCRSIGVSNFSQKNLDILLEKATVVPVVNQIEMHPLNPAQRILQYCRERGIHVMSYSTIGAFGSQSPILTEEIFTSIAKAHGCDVGIVSLSWAVQHGATVIPKSSNHERILSNAKLVALHEKEMATIDSACEHLGRNLVADHFPQFAGERDGRRTCMGWTLEDLGWEDGKGEWLM